MRYFLCAFLLASKIFIFYGMEKNISKNKRYTRIAANRNNKYRKYIYKCNECDGIYVDISRHIRVRHTDERPYVCPTCNETFAEAGYCAYHIRKKHPEIKPIIYIVHFKDKEPYERTVNESSKSALTITPLPPKLTEEPLEDEINLENFYHNFKN